MVKRIELSKRLYAIAKQVAVGSIVADVGTDHGYIPIYLVQVGISPKAYALDINEGPLKRAKQNVIAFEVEKQVLPVLSNGLINVLSENIDCIIIAGMGGMLVCELLEQGREMMRNIHQLILSPHLDVVSVRKKVHALGFEINHEELVLDQNKYYPIIVCRKGEEQYESEIEYIYGKRLIDSGNKMLLNMVEDRKKMIITLQEHLSNQASESCQNKREELNIELNQIDEVMQCLLR